MTDGTGSSDRHRIRECLVAQQVSLNYPSARRADVIDNYVGTKVADPYRWMEDLNSPELKQWIDAKNALAFGYLNALPQRDALKARITELWKNAKVTLLRGGTPNLDPARRSRMSSATRRSTTTRSEHHSRPIA